eukprot:TRINITY_DN701_c0_g1_i1.p2 TRINITY_DN701_c0_g1~~TRINITY_DN701_c0_g1_i1.p2  ORF type:complete len:342 (+),score=99.65 TRINITY_DN701_c0_g1_i1:92-1027(+)
MGPLHKGDAVIPDASAGGVQPGYVDYVHLVEGPGLTVKQTMKGCFRECLGCEALSEYRIADYCGIEEAGGGDKDVSVPPNFKLYALEESSCCWRCCICNVYGCSSGRPLDMHVSRFNPDDPEDVAHGVGKRGKGGPMALRFKKPCSCPVVVRIPVDDQGGTLPICCCCNLPRLESYDIKGAYLGYSQYVCDMYCCVPKWTVFDSTNTLRYLVRPDTCCCGCCIQCRCNGRKGACLYEPMLLRDPATRQPIMTNETTAASVSKVWSGIKKECCSEADNFAVLYPPGVDAAMKANLLGLTFLVDYCWYEGNQG